MITAAELSALAERITLADTEGEGVLEWIRGSGIELEALEDLLSAGVRSFHVKCALDGDYDGAVIDLVGQSFRLGFEARGLLADG